MQNENPNKSVSTKNDILEKEPQKVVKKEETVKQFQEKKLDEYFDKVEEKTEEIKNNFEEYTEEFKKDYIEKEEELHQSNQDNMSRETQISKPSTINKEPKDSLETVKKDEPKKTESKVDNKKIITSKDLYKYDGKSKPKIAIVIDDVSSSKQKRDILNIGYKVNMAFLPPTKGHPNSAKIAQDLPFSIIHFPMQATSRFKGAEIGTLEITDSYEKIEKRVKQLRAWYPNVTYTNNHTGSVFTQNEAAMDKLFRALKKYNFIFVDSRTTPKSVAKKMAKKYNMPYIVRNTFMDNEKNYTYIQNQLKKAIRIAKKRGYAIAIGHPYPITLKVLRDRKSVV